MDTIRTVKKLSEWEPCSSRPVGRPRLGWLEQVEEDLKKIKVRNWREKCRDRGLWKKIVKQTKTHRGGCSGSWRRRRRRRRSNL